MFPKFLRVSRNPLCDFMQVQGFTKWKLLRPSKSAMDLSMSRSKVKRAIDDLERHGFIKVEQRYRQSGAKSSLLFTVKDFEKYR